MATTIQSLPSRAEDATNACASGVAAMVVAGATEVQVVAGD